MRLSYITQRSRRPYRRIRIRSAASFKLSNEILDVDYRYQEFKIVMYNQRYVTESLVCQFTPI